MIIIIIGVLKVFIKFLFKGCCNYDNGSIEVPPISRSISTKFTNHIYSWHEIRFLRKQFVFNVKSNISKLSFNVSCFKFSHLFNCSVMKKFIVHLNRASKQHILFFPIPQINHLAAKMFFFGIQLDRSQLVQRIGFSVHQRHNN